MPQQIGLEAILDLGNFNRGAGEYNRTIAGMNTNTGRASGGMSKGLQGVGTVAMGVGKVVGGAAILATTAVGGMATSGVKAGISFESAWTGVLKTTDGLVDSTGELTDAGKELQQGFRDLAREKPVTFETLAAIGEMGGQLGIQRTGLLGYSSVVADLGATTNLTFEGAAEGVARLSNVMGTGQGEVENMGSTIVALGNNFAATESDILAFGQRISGAGALVGLAESDVLAIGTAVVSTGVEVEAGGTAIQKVLLGINESIVSGSDEVGVFAETAGMSAVDFAASWEANPAQAFTAFVEGLGTQGDAAIGTLSALGLEDSRLQRTFLSLGVAGSTLRDSIALGSQAWEDNTALATEAGLRYGTTDSQIQIMKNGFSDTSAELGTALLPAFQILIDTLTKLSANPAVLKFFEDMGTALAETLPGAITTATVALQLASGDWEAAWETLGISVEEAKAAVAEVDWVGEAETATTDLATGFSESASSVIDEVVIMLDAMTTEILEADWETVGSDAMGVLLAAMESAMTDIDWAGLGKKIITELIPGLFRAETAIKMAVTKLLRGALTQAVETANPSKAGENIVKAIAKGIPILEAQIKDALTKSLDKAKKAADTLAKDFVSIGEDIVGGIVKGLGNKIGALESWIKTNLIDKIPAWAREGLSIGSPSKVFAEIGVNVAEGFIVGIQSKIKDTDEAIKAMLDVGSKFSGFATFFSGLIADPNLQLRIDQLTKKVGRFAATANDVAGVDLGKLNSIELAKTKDALQQMSGLLNDPVLNGSIGNPFADLLAQFNSSALRDGLADKLTTSGELADLNQESITAILTSISMQENLNDLLAEQAAEEEKIAKIKQKQADLAFLQQQLDLVKLVKDADLPFEAEVFKGIEFGLGADPADILSATVAAMDAIIQQSSAGLAAQVDNSAPAQEVITETIPALNALTVGFKGAAPLLDAMVVGFKGAAPVVDAMIVSFKGAASALHGFGGFRGSAPVSGIVSGLGGAGGAGATNNSRNATVSLTFNPTINNGMDMNQFTNQVTQAVSGALATG